MEFSFQLYSARNFPPVAGIFPKLKALGYRQVEGFGGLYDQADELAAALKDNDLTMPTGHFGLDMLEDISGSIEIAEKLGIKTLICPAIPSEQRRQNSDGWKNLADKLAALGESYNKEGFKFGWHNHNFEFVATESGKLPMELLLDGAPDIIWQCDVAWLVKGKQEPLSWFERYGKRIASIHVKDIAPAGQCADEDGWADVGHGIMDWKALFAAIGEKTSCTSFVMEHDNPNDVMRFASRSIAAAQRFAEAK
ncbi:Sugar phosphate isomerases/epimerases [hydrothermal vent metagenome]|uniref:Sugar phosphate isomerases/epimerases n=1 Tax=hydrothermal vent metagenome TaxID=652676 RepID=A0A3B0UB68_9ZZZZ